MESIGQQYLAPETETAPAGTRYDQSATGIINRYFPPGARNRMTARQIRLGWITAVDRYRDDACGNEQDVEGITMPNSAGRSSHSRARHRLLTNRHDIQAR